MTPDEYKKHHPQAAAQLAEEERERVLAHQDVGRAIDCPSVAAAAIESGVSLQAHMPVYINAAKQHGAAAVAALEKRARHYGLALTGAPSESALAEPSLSTPGAPYASGKKLVKRTTASGFIVQEWE